MITRPEEMGDAKYRIDLVSRRTLLRLTLRSAAIVLLISWPWLAGLRTLDVTLDTLMGLGGAVSLFCGMIAIALREPFGRGSLNHWDEAMFYTAIARLTHFIHG